MGALSKVNGKIVLMFYFWPWLQRLKCKVRALQFYHFTVAALVESLAFSIVGGYRHSRNASLPVTVNWQWGIEEGKPLCQGQLHCRDVWTVLVILGLWTQGGWFLLWMQSFPHWSVITLESILFVKKKKKKKYSFISKIYINYGHLVYQNKLL